MLSENMTQYRGWMVWLYAMIDWWMMSHWSYTGARTVRVVLVVVLDDVVDDDRLDDAVAVEVSS